MVEPNFKNFYEHARRVLFALKHDLRTGTSVDMCIAFALVSLDNYRTAIPGPKGVYSEELRRIRVNQALQIAINQYEKSEVIQEIGEHNARIFREQWFALLRDFTGN